MGLIGLTVSSPKSIFFSIKTYILFSSSFPSLHLNILLTVTVLSDMNQEIDSRESFCFLYDDDNDVEDDEFD